MLDIETRIRQLSEESHMNEQQAKALLAFTSGLYSKDEFNSTMTDDVLSAFRTLKDANIFGKYHRLIREYRDLESTMKFSEVIDVVKTSIRQFEAYIQLNPNLVLSEADFERHLSNAISNLLPQANNSADTFVVHNQISHYPGDEPQDLCERDYQVDILIMKDKDIQKNETISKGFIYSGDAIPIELKYYRKGESVGSIEHDLKKSDSLLSSNFKCSFFVIALLEEENDNQKSTIQGYFELYNGKENMSTFLLSKTCNH